MQLDSNKGLPLLIRLGLITLVALAILIPRGVKLGQYAVVDEVDWLYVTARFYHALQTQEYENTYQIEHPAVTLMWLGTIGFERVFSDSVEYRSGYISGINKFHTDLLREGTSPIEILVAGRLFTILAVTLGLLAAYLLAAQMLGHAHAAFGFLLIGLDVFFVGLSRLLHMDGLLAVLFLLTILSFLLYSIFQASRVYLILSGVGLGLSMLTKTPAVFLVFFVLAYQIVEGFKKKQVIPQARTFFIWSIVGLVVFILLWPAMWVAPVNTIQKIIQLMQFYLDQGHVSLLFFNGLVDNGAGFPWYYYPLTFLWRTTPVVMLGLVGGLVGYFRRWGIFERVEVRKTAIVLCLAAILFMAFLQTGAKKFDRYIIPSYLFLDLLAGLGWLAVIEQMINLISRRLKPGTTTSLKIIALVLVVGFQALPLLRTTPYYLTYYNPWMGGPKKAPEVMMIGWGEGLDQAARYLNDQPLGGKAQVLSWYGMGPVSFYFHREFMHQPNVFNLENEVTPGGVDKLKQSDYLVLYINQIQRGYADWLAPILATLEPEHVVVLNEIEYAQVYNIAGIPDETFEALLP